MEVKLDRERDGRDMVTIAVPKLKNKKRKIVKIINLTIKGLFSLS